MALIIFTRDDVAKVMEEFMRRLDDELTAERAHGTPLTAKYIKAEIATRMQGVYGTIMAVVPKKNWCDVTWWLDDELENLFKHYDLGELYGPDGTNNLLR